MEKKNKHKFMIIPKYGNYYYPTSKVFEDDKGDVVYFGENNEFPQYVIELFNKSSINGTAIMAKRDGIIGEGLTADNEDILQFANRDGESWNDVFRKIAMDEALHNGYALEIIWSNDRTKITDIYHIDFSYIRAHKMDHKGIVPGYYISPEFENKGRLRVKKEDLHYLPRFNKLSISASNAMMFKPAL